MSVLPSGLTFRPYAPVDRSGGLAVFQSNVPRYFAESERSDFAAYLGSPDAGIWVVEQEHRILGLGGQSVSGDQGRLHWGMVDQSCHRHRIGSLLLSHRVGLLWAQPAVATISLNTSQHSAPFFERFGFEREQSTPDGYAPGIDRIRLVVRREAWIPPAGF